MRKMLLGGLLVLSLMAGISISHADPLKIGVVDLQQIIAPQDGVVRQKLNEQFADRQEQVRVAEQTINEETERLRKESATMQQSEVSELQDNIQALQRSASAMVENLQADYSRSYNREMNQYLQHVKESIDTFASDNGYDLILQRDAIPYGNSELDVTQLVLENIPQQPIG